MHVALSKTFGMHAQYAQQQALSRPKFACSHPALECKACMLCSCEACQAYDHSHAKSRSMHSLLTLDVFIHFTI